MAEVGPAYLDVSDGHLRGLVQGEQAPAVDPTVQAFAAALANLTGEQRQALAGLLGASPAE